MWHYFKQLFICYHCSSALWFWYLNNSIFIDSGILKLCVGVVPFYFSQIINICCIACSCSELLLTMLTPYSDSFLMGIFHLKAKCFQQKYLLILICQHGTVIPLRPVIYSTFKYPATCCRSIYLKQGFIWVCSVNQVCIRQMESKQVVCSICV